MKTTQLMTLQYQSQILEIFKKYSKIKDDNLDDVDYIIQGPGV